MHPEPNLACFGLQGQGNGHLGRLLKTDIYLVLMCVQFELHALYYSDGFTLGGLTFILFFFLLNILVLASLFPSPNQSKHLMSSVTVWVLWSFYQTAYPFNIQLVSLIDVFIVLVSIIAFSVSWNNGLFHCYSFMTLSQHFHLFPGHLRFSDLL